MWLVLDLVFAFCILGLRFTHSKSRFNQVPISTNVLLVDDFDVPVRNCGAELSLLLLDDPLQLMGKLVLLSNIFFVIFMHMLSSGIIYKRASISTPHMLNTCAERIFKKVHTQ